MRKQRSTNRITNQSAIQRALEIADAPELSIAGTLQAEIETFIAFKLSRNEFSRFSAENKKLTLLRFGKWIGLENYQPPSRPRTSKIPGEREHLAPKGIPEPLGFKNQKNHCIHNVRYERSTLIFSPSYQTLQRATKIFDPASGRPCASQTGP